MALISQTLVERGHEKVNITRGLNTERIGNYFADGDQTVFYYVETDDRRSMAIRYKADRTYTNFKSDMTATTGTRRPELTVLAKGINETEWDATVTIDADRIQYVYDHEDGSNGVVEFDNGAFDPLRYKINRTLSEMVSLINS